jgi:flagellar biosynthesis/type III secretory pathway protein FliH
VVAGDPQRALESVVDARVARAFAAGIAEGERRAQERAVVRLDLASAQLDHAREQAAAQTAQLVAPIVIEIARIVLHSEIAAGHFDIERVVRDTLAQSGVGRGRCTVHLHPVDAAALANVRFRADTHIEPDDSVARGDVHVTTPHGLLVREVDEILRAIASRLRAEAA